MQVSWEATTAVASLLSSLAVLAAVVVAIRQVRVGAAQVDHLQKATQLEGTMKIFEALGSAEQRKSRVFIVQELEQKLQDPAFREGMERVSYAPEAHPEMVSLRLLEMIGTYVKYGLLDEAIIFDFWYPAIVNVWERLDDLGVIAIHRSSGGPLLWENFEHLYERAKLWVAAHDPHEGDRAWSNRPVPAQTSSGTKP